MAPQLIAKKEEEQDNNTIAQFENSRNSTKLDNFYAFFNSEKTELNLTDLTQSKTYQFLLRVQINGILEYISFENSQSLFLFNSSLIAHIDISFKERAPNIWQAFQNEILFADIENPLEIMINSNNKQQTCCIVLKKLFQLENNEEMIKRGLFMNNKFIFLLGGLCETRDGYQPIFSSTRITRLDLSKKPEEKTFEKDMTLDLKEKGYNIMSIQISNPKTNKKEIYAIAERNPKVLQKITEDGIINSFIDVSNVNLKKVFLTSICFTDEIEKVVLIAVDDTENKTHHQIISHYACYIVDVSPDRKSHNLVEHAISLANSEFENETVYTGGESFNMKFNVRSKDKLLMRRNHNGKINICEYVLNRNADPILLL